MDANGNTSDKIYSRCFQLEEYLVEKRVAFSFEIILFVQSAEGNTLRRNVG